MTARVRVLIADDQQLVRDGLRMILDATDDIEVVGAAVDGAEALTLSRDVRPDIVLMDVQMPNVDGIQATRLVLAGPLPRPRVVVLTTFGQAEVVYDALAAGASGFLLKDMPAGQLVGGIRAVARGEELLAPSLTRQLIAQVVAERSRPPRPELSRLTERESEVLRLVARGQSNAEIAATLTLSVETVKTHVSRVLDKLGVRDRVHAVIFAYEAGVVRTAD